MAASSACGGAEADLWALGLAARPADGGSGRGGPSAAQQRARRTRLPMVAGALFQMDEGAQMWRETQCVLDDDNLVLMPGSECAGATIALMGCSIAEYPDGRPGHGSLISNNCFVITEAEAEEGKPARSHLLKAQNQPDFTMWVRGLAQRVVAHGENLMIQRVQRLIHEAEMAAADAQLRGSPS